MNRKQYLHLLQQMLKENPAVALLGPRQCGKTTLARMYADQLTQPVHVFDLEDPLILEKLKQPKLALEELSGLIIMDEIQRLPEIFPYLRVLIDRPEHPAKFLILGSASRDLIRQSSESLAGRISFLELTPFTYQEVDHWERFWLRGGFPKSYLAESDEASFRWRYQYITTFLERDLPELGFHIPAQMLRRFWMMLAHYHGNIFNASELGRSLNLSSPTLRRYLDILTGMFMIRQLYPWFANIKKRQVKSPKIYFRDSGFLHVLLGISDLQNLKNHPKLGASWEGVAVEEIIRAHHATPDECYFWATHTGAELDLLIAKNGKKLGFEIKYSDVPHFTPSMRHALEDLELDKLTVIFPGKDRFRLTEQVEAVGLEAFLTGNR